jgi:MFS family permease
MLKRNILIAYILAFSKNTWFWLGIWVFYYLRFTNYAGIGIIETTLILTMTLAEIPTGAVADLFGKKKTLILAFLLEAIGSFIMATAGSFEIIAFSVFVMCVGGAFYSGTIDALVFDTLKQHGEESSYDKKISNINTISLITPAICSILGGFLYKLNPTFPFFANGIGYVTGFLASFFLIEPAIDTEKFSLTGYISQTKQGFKELFKTVVIKQQTIYLLSIGFLIVISSEMLNGFLAIEFGFIEEQQGILWSIIFFVSALASQLTPKIMKIFKGNSSITFLGVIICFSFLISPFAGLIVGGLSLVFRASSEGIYSNLSSILINNSTESRYRATTISTFNMIKNIPYVLSAYFVGLISDEFSAKNTALYLGVLLAIYIIFHFLSEKNSKHKKQLYIVY